MTMFELISINDNEEFCVCCGKQGLSKVAWLLNKETNEESHYGVICAGKLLSKNDAKELKAISLKSSLFNKHINGLMNNTNINKWFKHLQLFHNLWCNETKLVPKDLMMIINYLREVICYDGKSLGNPEMYNRFIELNFIDYNDLLSESKLFFKD